MPLLVRFDLHAGDILEFPQNFPVWEKFKFLTEHLC